MNKLRIFVSSPGDVVLMILWSRLGTHRMPTKRPDIRAQSNLISIEQGAGK